MSCFLFLCCLLCVMVTTAWSIAGKTALVTGSSGGIGAGIAKRLAREGARVWVHYHTRHKGALATRDEIERNGGICLGILQCDFCRDENIHAMMEGLRLDILINNAGAITKLAMEDDDDHVSAWKHTFQINVHAPVLLSKLFRAQHIINNDNENDGAVIVNVSSIHGEKSCEYMSAYAASKAALDSVTRAMALEWSGDGIRVNAVAPGIVPVERTAGYFEDPESTQIWLDRLPRNQNLGTVSGVADVVVPLLTNNGVTGTIWRVDCGQMARANFPNRPKPTKQ